MRLRIGAFLGRPKGGNHTKKGGFAVPKEIVRVPGISDALEKAKVPLSSAVKANGFVFCSGMPPMNPETGEIVRGDIETQTRAVLDCLKKVLEASGSSLDQVVKSIVFIANSAYFPTVNAIYKEYFPHDPPARTFATVGSWPWEFDIEIECVALAE